jgi:predicted O-linked N-acetylglucosamine transferase (SPINDLY family)
MSPLHGLMEEGFRLYQSGRLAEAEKFFQQVLALDPRHADALHLLGIIAHLLGQNERAVEMIGKAIESNPTIAAYHANRGTALQELGRLEEAIAAFNTALRCKPDYAAAHYNKGNALKELGRPEEAILAFSAALRLKPDYTEAYTNMGDALKELGRLEEAIAAFDTALRLEPDAADIHSNRASALLDLRRYGDAIAAFTTALRFKPDDADIHSNLVMCLYYQPGTSDESILQASRRFAEQIAARPRTSFMNSAEPGRRLRIGYVSGDLKRHPVGYFLAPVLPNHDPDAVEIYCYSNRREADDMTAKLRRAAHHWRSLIGLSDDEAAAQIIADGIDILVDLSGHTGKNRLVMFAGRAAPVQVTWLGFWGTTGLPAMDYVVSDEDTIPPEQERFYTERVVRLPGGRFCYEPPDYAPEPVAPPCLATGGVTFGSFNNLTKLGPDVIRLWARVLHAVPGAQLLLKWKSLTDEGARQRLTSDFAAEGIGAERLILRGQSPHEAMLKEYGEIDIALDPFPFSGGLTSCEALWMGLPVVTLPGPAAASRQTLGFLRAIERTEWAATSPEDYIRIAASLAVDQAGLAVRRAGQRQRLAATALCDGKSFARGLEAAYRIMWRDWCQAR